MPTWSGMLNGLERQFVGGEHGTIYRVDALRRALATLLEKPGVLAGVPDKVEVSLRDKVVEPGDEVHVRISFEGSVGDFSGVLTLERAQLEPLTERVVAFDPPNQVYPVTHQGVGMEGMSLVFVAPDLPGPYRVAFRDTETAAPSGYDELIVQQP